MALSLVRNKGAIIGAAAPTNIVHILPKHHCYLPPSLSAGKALLSEKIPSLLTVSLFPMHVVARAIAVLPPEHCLPTTISIMATAFQELVARRPLATL
ncbi:Os03g0711450 [Oryza sativa Japonica Group]|uniref:Os03g0711450 protein n=1 Tax=Oryza sativa subsp. japonica TaxID=39947 RepID=A0A0P0W2S1_ORYSJ|nr:Os03g0711450 [Oryza sativa Japonica Group]